MNQDLDYCKVQNFKMCFIHFDDDNVQEEDENNTTQKRLFCKVSMKSLFSSENGQCMNMTVDFNSFRYSQAFDIVSFLDFPLICLEFVYYVIFFYIQKYEQESCEWDKKEICYNKVTNEWYKQ